MDVSRFSSNTAVGQTKVQQAQTQGVKLQFSANPGDTFKKKEPPANRRAMWVITDDCTG